MIKAIIFDWHGVLDTTKLERLITQLATITDKNEAEIKTIIGSFERAYTKGETRPSSFWSKIKQALNLNDEELNQAKASILTVHLYEPLWKQLLGLHNKYKLAILSDCPKDKVDIIRDYTDLSFFQVIYFSSEKHNLKDSNDFFLDILKALGEEPQNCLYVDDNQKHIATASSLGFQICYFKGINDLNKYLDK